LHQQLVNQGTRDCCVAEAEAEGEEEEEEELDDKAIAEAEKVDAAELGEGAEDAEEGAEMEEGAEAADDDDEEVPDSPWSQLPATRLAHGHRENFVRSDLSCLSSSRDASVCVVM
jgi:hypothetical protein